MNMKRVDEHADQCAHCQLDTAGNHESHCPLYEESKLRGATTDHLFYYDDKFGFVHISETEKLKEAYERFRKLEGLDGIILVSSPAPTQNYFHKLWKEASEDDHLVRDGRV